jgi:hypothetical protein
VAAIVGEPGAARVWAAVADDTEAEEPPYRGGGIWLGE